MKKTLFLGLFALLTFNAFSQGSPDYGGGMKVNFNEDGSKYMRFITWGQVWAQYNDNMPEGEKAFNTTLRRARFITYAQLTPKFLILTHFGINSLSADNMSPVGKGESSQLFLHDFWVQYKVADKHDVGAGLHYWNGISRLNNEGTLNFLTLDNNRQSWSTLGLSDQFARHQGIYGKGAFGKLQYRVSINEAITNGIDARDPETNVNTSIYGGRRILGSKDSGMAYAGYFEYGFKDAESNLLPYKVGTYLGTKKVFNLGAGFFLHPNGSVMNDGTKNVGEDVSIFAVDAFYDAPIGDSKAAITGYLTYQNNNYGKNYLFNAYGTGSFIYGHVGYLLPTEKTTKLQPYLSYASNSYDAVDDNRNVFGAGANLFLNGHNSKLTLEYKNEKFGETKTGTVTLQAMIYL
ncbi:hypothetical protein [Flavobacterium sp.]|uniref:hypothetical protein n=1 Tax=Flavobacterium sp. TaxID=239 RepID=UPI0025C08AAB|nr:hypothetical protein [Flavobacterium sp.]MBA4154333.1 hypothetical protein [Flavobacterium sp.]